MLIICDVNFRHHSTLSSHTLAALAEFNAERDAHQEQFERLKAEAEANAGGVSLSMDAFTEDWNESQFWVCMTRPHRLSLSLSFLIATLLDGQ
jgi:hypothetical protein